MFACSYASLVDERSCYFSSMSQDYSLSTGTEHYICMVNFLSHSGHLDEAEDIVNKMQVRLNVAQSSWLENTRCAGIFAVVRDLLCRREVGWCNECENLMERDSFSIWEMAKQAAKCRLVLKTEAAECLLDLKTEDVRKYLLLSNIYSAARRWDVLIFHKKSATA